MPYFSAGTAAFKGWYIDANHAANTHHEETNANWTSDRVTGFGRVIRIALDDVFDMIEVVYHAIHRN